MRLALAAVNLFAWVFVFQFFFARGLDIRHALLYTVFLYAISQDVVALVTPLAAKRLRGGVIAPMAQGIVVAAIAYLGLVIAFSGALGAYMFFGVLAFALLRGLYRALYWVPYQVDAPTAAPRSASTRTTQEILIAVTPAVAGLILASGFTGFYVITMGAVALLCVALVLLYRVGDRTEGYSWGYIETFKKLIHPRYSTLVWTSLLDGISGAALLLFWPIAIFLLVGWSYPMLGIIMSLTYLFVYFARSYVRSLIRYIRLEESAYLHALLAASSWVFRLMVSSPLSIVLVDTYYYTGTQARGTGFDMSTFEQLADGGSYIDEMTTLKEIALAVGKVLMCGFGAVLLLIMSLPFAFICIFIAAAAASAASALLAHERMAL